MNHSVFLAKLSSLKFLPLHQVHEYNYAGQAYCHYVFAGEKEEGLIVQGESVEFGPLVSGMGKLANALLTRCEIYFSILLTPEALQIVKETIKGNPRVTIKLETLVEDKIAVAVRLDMGLSTPEDVFNDLSVFRKIGTFQPKWTKNPPLLFGPAHTLDTLITSWENDPEAMQKALVRNSQIYIDHAMKAKVYPFDKIVHPGIGTHDLY